MNWLLLIALLIVPSYNMIPEKPQPKELVVYASGNLKDPLDSISTYFERSNPDWKVKYRFGASDELVQLADGRLPVDVLIISDKENMDTLQEQGLISGGAIKPFIQDRVVIVLDAQSEYEVRQPKDLVMGAEIKRFALSGEKTPLGVLSRAYLTKLGLQELPQEKLVNAKNPKACVNAVKSGDAKWTFCYNSDAAAIRKRLRVLFTIPPSDIPATDYYKVILKGSKNQAAAQKYLETLDSTISRMLFDNQGYTAPGAPIPPPQEPRATQPQTRETQTHPAQTQTHSAQTQSQPAQNQTHPTQTQTQPSQTQSQPAQTQTAPTENHN
jgi:molybdenum ABC transporter molybdate-binding protein